MCRPVIVHRVSKISDLARAIVRAGSIDPWQIILHRRRYRATVSCPSRGSIARLIIYWMRWLTSYPRRYKSYSLASIASVAKSVLNRPDLSSNQVLGLVNRSIGSYTIIFPFPRASILPASSFPSSTTWRKSKTHSIGSRDWTRTHEGIFEEWRGKKDRVASIRLKNVVACLCRFSICCFARERFQNPLTYTREIFERYGHVCRRKDCIVRNFPRLSRSK